MSSILPLERSVHDRRQSAVSERQADAYAQWFRALGDATRIRILNLLARNEAPLCVCDIVDHFSIGQPSISHHLRILRDAGFVTSERRGTFMYYRVNNDCLAEFPNAARSILGLPEVEKYPE